MTFINAAWAIDGATMRSSLARAQAYIACSGAQGVAQRSDLKVSQLGTPGNGLLIASGSAVVLNGYQGDIFSIADQAYTVINPATHTVGSPDMPASSGSTTHYILAIVIGDPEFAQTGHPFMGPTDPPSGTEATFSYVRPVMIACSSTATSLSSTLGYPAIPLARIDIPPSTTTITNAMITDIRQLARPRNKLEQGFVTATGAANVTTAWARIGPTGLTVDIPRWAVKAKIQGFVEGLRLTTGGGNGKIEAYFEVDSRAGSVTNVNENSPGHDADRRSYSVGGIIDVSDLAGTNQKLSIRAQANSSGDNNFLKVDTSTSVFVSVYFEEQPI